MKQILNTLKVNQWQVGKASWTEGDGVVSFIVKNNGDVYGYGDYQKSIGYLKLKDLTTAEKQGILISLKKANLEDLQYVDSNWLNFGTTAWKVNLPREFYSGQIQSQFQLTQALDCVFSVNGQMLKHHFMVAEKIKNLWEYQTVEDIEVLSFDVNNQLQEKIIQKGTVVMAGNCTEHEPYMVNVVSPFNPEHAIFLPILKLNLVDSTHPYLVSITHQKHKM